jgi:dihydroneopterin aldolase
MEVNCVADRILLRGIEFYGFHGVPAAERETGHRFAVDLALELDLRAAGRADDLGETVDYGEVCRQVLAIGQGPPVQLIETLAERIAATCLTCYPKIEAVEVTVRKRLPPVNTVVEEAGVRIYRRRE